MRFVCLLLMGIQNVFVYTHDSIGQGEDGPTHQPVEQLANLRMTPNMSVWRPCDAAETAVAWKAGIERRDGPTSLVFYVKVCQHSHVMPSNWQMLRKAPISLRTVLVRQTLS